MPKTPKPEAPDKTAFEIMSRLVKQPPKTHDEMVSKPEPRTKPQVKRAQPKRRKFDE